jgi:hypothetical protein
MRAAGVSKTAVWPWQERFMADGVDGLLRDKTRPPRVPKLADAVAERIVALTLSPTALSVFPSGNQFVRKLMLFQASPDKPALSAQLSVAGQQTFGRAEPAIILAGNALSDLAHR